MPSGISVFMRLLSEGVNCPICSTTVVSASRKASFRLSVLEAIMVTILDAASVPLKPSYLVSARILCTPAMKSREAMLNWYCMDVLMVLFGKLGSLCLEKLVRGICDGDNGSDSDLTVRPREFRGSVAWNKNEEQWGI